MASLARAPLMCSLATLSLLVPIALLEERIAFTTDLGVGNAIAARERAHISSLSRNSGGRVLLNTTLIGGVVVLVVGGGGVGIGNEYLLEKLPLIPGCRVGKGLLGVHPHQVDYHLESVALINEELLPLRRVEHLLRVSRDEGVEKGVELAVGTRLWTKNAPKPLRFLPAGSKVRGDLDDYVRLGQVDGGVPNLRNEYGVDLVPHSELAEIIETFLLARRSVDEWAAKLDCILLEREDVIGEDDDLVAAPLVVAHQKLARAELARVHRIEQPLHGRVALEILTVELSGHVTPHLSTLHVGDVALVLQVDPVGLVKLRSDQEIEVLDLAVLSHQCRCEPEL
mmetsp:Transcript_22115/g.47725  ORF Transcript_22115/g.47725 Transcript_22115/m.47725 type:complete len:340 (-) Transcript_22115:1298-2317(-)